MRFRRSVGPADRAESEGLLDAARDSQPPAPEIDPLAHLLAAAAAPAEPGELSGEAQALAAFRAARAAPVPAPARAPRPRGRLRVGAAAWLAGLAATASAGVAFAAVSLDRPDEPAPPPSTTPGSTGGGSAASPTGGHPTASGTPGPASTTGAGPTPTGGPGQPAGAGSLTGHCQAYLAKSPHQRAKALQTRAFADLVAAAGGADRVADYCLRLVPERAPRSPSGAPAPSSATGAATPAPGRSNNGTSGTGNTAPGDAGAGNAVVGDAGAGHTAAGNARAGDPAPGRAGAGNANTAPAAGTGG